MSGPALCARLDWDSDFFGFPIARVVREALDREDAAAAVAWCQAQSVRCLYYLCPADSAHVRAAEAVGFRLADVRLTLGLDARPDAEDAADDVRVARPGDFETLRAIARASFEDTRFFRDPGFPRHKSEQLYEIWIDKACRDEAQTVLVDRRDVPTGFITCLRDPDGSGRIGLTGVAPHARGQGVGRHLLRGALDYFRREGAAQVSVATQGQNVAAQRLYQQAGFQTSDVRFWFHWWSA